MTTNTRTPHALAALCALAIAAGGATAQQPSKNKPREATLGGGGGSGPTLSRDQLRQCLVEQGALKGEGDTLAREQQRFDADKAELTRAGAALKEQFEALNKSNAEALKAHIEKTKEHDQRVDAWNAKLPAFNERARALQARNASWKGDCADRRYREDDLILLQARKQVPAGAK